jgi:CheY-specific phosphatase CheX
MPAFIDEHCVIRASAQFWEQMLAMELVPVPIPEPVVATCGDVIGSVNLSGVWSGRIEVRLTGRLATTATAAMLMLPLETVGEADTLDAAKEIANMIAGVIKSCLPRPCTMTVPEASMESSSLPGRSLSAESLVVAFRHSAGDQTVRVWEQERLQ